MLMKGTGEFVKANFGKNFMQSLMTDDINLAAGTYVVMVDPVWNTYAKADTSEEFKKVLVDVYAPEKVELEVLEYDEGMTILA